MTDRPAQSNAPRNAAQFTALQSHYESQLKEIIAAMNLRRWLVEKTIGTNLTLTDLESLHTFIIKPALTGIDPPKGDE